MIEDIGLAKEFQKNLSGPSCKNGLTNQGKYLKQAIQSNLNENYYHVQYRKYVSHTTIKMSYATTQFPVLPFCGLYLKPHFVRGLIKYYRLFNNQNLVM